MITKVLRLIPAILAVAWLVSCGRTPPSPEGVAINRVLNKDAQTERGLGELKPLQATREVVARKRKIDLTGCPQDFRDAYVAHIEAWSVREERIANELKEFANAVHKKGWIKGIGDGFKLVGQQQAANQNISDTFEEVRRLALRYGADVPSTKPAPEVANHD